MLKKEKKRKVAPQDLLQLWLPWPSQRHTCLWCRTSQSLCDPHGTGASWTIRRSSRTCQQTETTNTKCCEPPSSLNKDAQTRTEPAHKDKPTDAQATHASSPSHPLLLHKTAVRADVMLTWKAQSPTHPVVGQLKSQLDVGVRGDLAGLDEAFAVGFVHHDVQVHILTQLASHDVAWLDQI